jgi:AmmeMemoRadiSam system protein A
MEITEKEKGILLLAARKSIGSLFNKVVLQKIDYSLYPTLQLHLGAFVTLMINKDLRGCIGYIFTDKTLYGTVCEAAKQAAFSDPRFPPLTEKELDLINIEISVLSFPQKINDYSEIIIGEHGLILDEGFIRAVLLPQVAVKNNFNREQFLSALCEKGRLKPDKWKTEKLNLQVFTAIIFYEGESYA